MKFLSRADARDTAEKLKTFPWCYSEALFQTKLYEPTNKMDRPMKISNLSGRNLESLQEGLIMIQAMKINEDYLECIKAIMGLMELFKDDAGFHKLLVDLRDETKNLWRKKIDKNKKTK